MNWPLGTGLGQRELRCAAGGDVDEMADQSFAFAETTGVARDAGEELDRVVSRQERREIRTDGCRRPRSIARVRKHGEVLQIVGTRVSVARVVGGSARSADEIQRLERIGVDPVGQHPIVHGPGSY
jgi:hypothetical protein